MDTLTDEWCKVSARWDQILSFLSEPLLKRINFLPSSHKNWDTFRMALFTALNNRNEFTSHPLWVLHMLGEASDWASAEKRYEPTISESKTVEKIISLHLANPNRSQQSIADELVISRQRVSSVLSQFKIK